MAAQKAASSDSHQQQEQKNKNRSIDRLKRTEKKEEKPDSIKAHKGEN